MIEIERIEREATRDQSKPRTGGAVAERAADVLAFERRAVQHVSGKIRIGEHHPSETDEIRVSLADLVLCNMRQPLLQVRVTGADDDHARKRGLEQPRGFEQPGHAVEWIFRGLIPVAGREQCGPLRVRTVIRASRRDADPAHFPVLQHLQHLPGLGK